MNSTPTPKAIEPHNAVIARADEQLAHAHEEIARADEELARLSEQVAKMERDAARPPSAGPDPQSPPRRRALRALVGLPLAACIVVAALVLESSYGGGAKQVVARWAPQLVSNCIIAAGKRAASRAARSIYRSSGRGGGSTAASNAPGPDRTARRCAGSDRNACRTHTAAANDGARSRECGAKHRTAQGEPATNSQREFKSHRGAQGEPGRDKTRAREGFRAEPAQDVTSSDEAASDLAQARTNASVPVRESAAPNPKGVDLRRRMVAVDAVIILSVPAFRPMISMMVRPRLQSQTPHD